MNTGTEARLPEAGVSRRAFLAGVGAAVAVTAIKPSLFAAGQERKLGFAFVGLGGYATRQLMPAVKECTHVRIAALVSGTPAKLERYGKQYGVPEGSRYSYETMGRLADNPDVDVVYVVTPPGLHLRDTEAAAKAGKHVICEKPMARTADECQRMIDAVKGAGKRLFIGYRIHTEPYNLEAMRVVREGELGKLKRIETAMGFTIARPGSWRLSKELAGGGPLMDIGIYGLNACRYLTGEEPVEVSATTSATPGDPRWVTVEEHCDFTLKFPSGVVATNKTSYNCPGWNRYACTFEKGSLEMNPATPYRGLKMWVTRGERREERKKPDVNQQAVQMDAQAKSIIDGGELRSTGEEGKLDLKVIGSIYASAAAGGKPVKL